MLQNTEYEGGNGLAGGGIKNIGLSANADAIFTTAEIQPSPELQSVVIKQVLLEFDGKDNSFKLNDSFFNKEFISKRTKLNGISIIYFVQNGSVAMFNNDIELEETIEAESNADLIFKFRGGSKLVVDAGVDSKKDEGEVVALRGQEIGGSS